MYVFSQKEVDEVVAKFRVLKDWEISCKKDGDYVCQATVLPDRKKACIYPWEDDNPPKDYLLHEVMHCALMYLRNIKNWKEAKEVEEIIVQDLCKIYRDLEA